MVEKVKSYCSPAIPEMNMPQCMGIQIPLSPETLGVPSCDSSTLVINYNLGDASTARTKSFYVDSLSMQYATIMSDVDITPYIFDACSYSCKANGAVFPANSMSSQCVLQPKECVDHADAITCQKPKNNPSLCDEDLDIRGMCALTCRTLGFPGINEFSGCTISM